MIKSFEVNLFVIRRNKIVVEKNVIKRDKKKYVDDTYFVEEENVFNILKDIKKRNINALTFKELLKNPYIDYDLCKKIFEYKDEIAEFQDISELKNIKACYVKTLGIYFLFFIKCLNLIML